MSEVGLALDIPFPILKDVLAVIQEGRETR